MFKAYFLLILSGCVVSLVIGPAGIIVALIILPFIIFGSFLDAHDQREVIGRASGRRRIPGQADPPADPPTDWDELSERLRDGDL